MAGRVVTACLALLGAALAPVASAQPIPGGETDAPLVEVRSSPPPAPHAGGERVRPDARLKSMVVLFEAQREGVDARTYRRARRWFEARGLRVVKRLRRRSALVLAGRVAAAEDAFETELAFDEHGRRVPVQAPRLPAWMRVRGVLGLGDGPRIRPLVPHHVAVPGTNPALAPADVTLVYGVDALHAQGWDGAGSSIAVLGRANVSDADLAAFAAAYATTRGFAPVERVFTRPGDDPGGGDPLDALEAAIDTQWAGAIAPGATVRLVVASPGDDIPEALLTAVDERVADVISISFGLCEPFADRLLAEFFDEQYAQALRQGQTVLVAAGDAGATDCAPASPVLAVNALASSTHAVAVGGTALDPLFDASGAATGHGGERAWSGGGGGSSLLFARPPWQDGLVGLAGRMLPDVALAADPHRPGYVIVRDGRIVVTGGTSVAAPVVAALVAIANQRAGRSVGAVLPSLYAAARQDGALFRDVTEGSNGYPATTGFDLATGWGSPQAGGFTAALAGADTRCEPLWPCVVPARPKRRACLAGWKLGRGEVATRRSGRPRRVQSCRDGDPGCDLDGSPNGTCGFEVSLCLNVADPRQARCPARVVDRLRLQAPSACKAGAAVRQRLEESLSRLPELPTDLRDACGAPALVEVPLSDSGRAGRRVLRATAWSGGRRARAVVKLTCLPTQ